MSGRGSEGRCVDVRTTCGSGWLNAEVSVPGAVATGFLALKPGARRTLKRPLDLVTGGHYSVNDAARYPKRGKPRERG